MHFIEEAGFGIYPVLVFGIAALIVAVRQAVAPRPGRVASAGWLMALTGLAGLLGTITGMQKSAMYLHQTSEKWIFLVGLQESLNNMVAACILIMLTMLVLLAAQLRNSGRPLAQRTPEPVRS